jgi:hypothetical protein
MYMAGSGGDGRKSVALTRSPGKLPLLCDVGATEGVGIKAIFHVLARN